MLKISIFDTQDQRRLVVEGKLIAPWAAELRNVWRKATADLNGRELVVDVNGLTAITEDGEQVLLELMKEGARFHSSGVFTKWVLKCLACKIRINAQEARDDRREKTNAKQASIYTLRYWVQSTAWQRLSMGPETTRAQPIRARRCSCRAAKRLDNP